MYIFRIILFQGGEWRLHFAFGDGLLPRFLLDAVALRVVDLYFASPVKDVDGANPVAAIDRVYLFLLVWRYVDRNISV